MIIFVCIEIFAVPSIFLQRIINESSMTEQWNIKYSEIATKKIIMNICIEIIKVSLTSLQRIINDYSIKQQWNINVLVIITLETSMIFSVCIHILVVSSMLLQKYYQRVIIEATMKRQCFEAKHHKIDNDQYCSHRNFRYFIDICSKNQQQTIKEAAVKHHWFRD